MAGKENAQMRTVSADVLRKIEIDLFRKMGFTPEGAAIVADSLVEADLRGVNSHGVIRVPVYIARLQHNVVFPDGAAEVVKDFGAVAVIDGHDTFGQVCGTKAMKLAIEKAKQYGIGCVGVINSHHYGAVAYYTEMAARENMVGFSTTNATPLMTPPGGAAKMVGNNPISIAFPAGNKPAVILDMACSAVAHGKIQLAAKNGQDIPLGWATDPEGNPTTDAGKAMTGFLCPVGGHKGFGLAVIMDLLTGPLLNGHCGGEITGLTGCYERPQGCGHFFAAIDVTKFSTIEQYTQNMQDYIAYIKSCPTVSSDTTVYMPGEIEYNLKQQRLREGIPLPASVVDDLIKTCQELGVDTQDLA